MKTLLTEIKDALETMSQLGGDPDACYITHDDDNWRPSGIGTSCISIKPGVVDREELAGKRLEITARVEIGCCLPVNADGENVLCTDSGLYDFASDIQAILKDNDLGLSDFDSVRVGSDREPVEIQVGDNNRLLRLTREYIYTLERDE